LACIPAKAEVLSLVGTDINHRGYNSAFGLRDAVLYTLGELDAQEALPGLLALADTDALYGSVGLRWALGCLASRADTATRERVRTRLEVVRISEQTLRRRDGTVSNRSISGLFDPNLGNQEEDIASEIAGEHSLILLGGSKAPLRELVSGVLDTWTDRQESRVWGGYSANSMLQWALIALRHHPDIGTERARPFLLSTIPLARTLATQLFRADP